MSKKSDRSELTKEELQEITIEDAEQEAPEAVSTEQPENPGTIDTMELRSEEVQEILTRVPHWMISWGSTLFLILILLILFISWIIKYPDVIPSETFVTTEIPPQKEYATITRKIQTIFVEDNEEVAENTPLAILENTANYKDVFLLKSIIDTITLNNNSFTFPVPLDSLPILYLGDIDADFALFENSYAQYDLNKKEDPFANEATANRLSIAESRNRLRSSISEKELAESELSIKKNDLDNHKTLLDKGVISTQQYNEKKLEYIQAEKTLGRINLSISQLRETISGASKTSRGTEINKEREEKKLLKAVNQSIIQLQRAIKDWEFNYLLKSDIAGKVSFMNVWNVNQTVIGGDLVFTIIPSEHSSYIAKLKAPAQNSGKIVIGQTVNIKLENYPDDEFGVLKGTIKNISLLPDKEGFYLVNVALPEKLITTYDKEIVFQQEMRGTAEIITEDLRLIERFFYQLKDVLSK